MPNLIVSLCGTSLLTHGATENERRHIIASANVRREQDLTAEQRAVLMPRLQAVAAGLASWSSAQAAERSAELNALAAFYQGQFAGHGSDQHYLISTDTWLGRFTAEQVAHWLEQHGVAVQVLAVDCLQTADPVEFQSALSWLVRWCAEDLAGWCGQYHVVFNLTGGFKSVQGFMQTLAMFYADEAIYLFENGRNLLRVPRLPVVLATQATVQQHLPAFRRLAAKLPTHTDGIPETLLLRIGDDCDLSEWGQLVWQQARPELYGAALLESPSPRLCYGPNFAKTVHAETGGDRVRLRLVNERIDALVRFLELGATYNVKSLDFKALQGNSVPPSTHEIDAWSDGGAKRIMAHYVGEQLMLDCLHAHL